MLQERAALLEAQTNASPDGVLVIDKNYKQTLMNQQFIEICNIPKHILNNNYSLLITHIENLTKYPDLFLKKVKHLHENDNEISYDEIEFKNGTIIDLYSSPVLGENKKNYGRIWRFHNITERKKADKELRESEMRLRAITDSAYDAIMMIDSKGRVSYWNPAAERIFGYTRTEAIGQMMHALIAPSRYHTTHNEKFPEFLRTGKGSAIGKTIDLEGRKKDGTEISVQLSLSAIQINNEWNAVGIIRDITEQKLAEKTLKIAKETAEVATRAKSEFLANMSHEVRTPMNGVLGMLGLLLDTNLTENQNLYAKTALASGKALLTLLNDILDFSKIEAGKLEIHIQDFNLKTLLDDIIEIMMLQAKEKGLALKCRIAPEISNNLQGDPSRLRQILINLTGNAIKFTAHGEIAINVNIISETPTETQLQFAVSDTGIGIPTDKINKLFKRFSQVDSSSTRTYGGTGLGLAISKQLVDLMHGEIGVKSENNKGSEFWFTVILTKQTTKQTINKNGITPKPVATRSLKLGNNFTPAKILVVEDNFTNQQVATGILKKIGFITKVANNGAEAIKELETCHYDLILMDVQMPIMDGIEATKNIRDPKSNVLNHNRLVLN